MYFSTFLIDTLLTGTVNNMGSRSDIRLERAVELSPETKAIAEKELRETPERTREALERLRELLKENKDLFFGDDDEILTIFLRPCKWYPESAIQLVSDFVVHYILLVEWSYIPESFFVLK